MRLLEEAKKLIIGLQDHNGKSICVMERLKLLVAINETEKCQTTCAMRHDCLAADGENFCSSCGFDLAEMKQEVDADATRSNR